MLIYAIVVVAVLVVAWIVYLKNDPAVQAADTEVSQQQLAADSADADVAAATAEQQKIEQQIAALSPIERMSPSNDGQPNPNLAALEIMLNAVRQRVADAKARRDAAKSALAVAKAKAIVARQAVGKAFAPGQLLKQAKASLIDQKLKQPDAVANP